MLLRRRFSENVQAMIVPTICSAVIAYFGYAGTVGPRGLAAWHNTESDLSVARHDLAQARAERKALQHRITLLDDKALDPDLLEEVARSVLAQGRPDEVVVPREKH